jgi:hypothetical protein
MSQNILKVNEKYVHMRKSDKKRRECEVMKYTKLIKAQTLLMLPYNIEGNKKDDL